VKIGAALSINPEARSAAAEATLEAARVSARENRTWPLCLRLLISRYKQKQ
jgi:hypothetical protein